MTPLLRSAARRASRKDFGFGTPHVGMTEPRTQRVVMDGRRAEQHVLFSGLQIIVRVLHGPEKTDRQAETHCSHSGNG